MYPHSEYEWPLHPHPGISVISASHPEKLAISAFLPWNNSNLCILITKYQKSLHPYPALSAISGSISKKIRNPFFLTLENPWPHPGMSSIHAGSPRNISHLSILSPKYPCTLYPHPGIPVIHAFPLWNINNLWIPPPTHPSHMHSRTHPCCTHLYVCLAWLVI
jgi:hypothetical protein